MKNRKFVEFSSLQNLAENFFISQPCHDTFFSDCFRTNTDSSSGRKTCSMRYAKVPPIFSRILPGLLLVVEFVAPEHLSLRRSVMQGSRDDGIHGIIVKGRVVFSSSLSMFSSINIYLDCIPDADCPRSRRDELRFSLINAAIATARTVARLS